LKLNAINLKKLERAHSVVIKNDGLIKSPNLVTPVQEGVYNTLQELGSRLRGNDREERKMTFYECINNKRKEKI